MREDYLHEISQFAAIMAAAGILGLLTDWLPWSLAGGMAVYCAWHIYRLARLPAIINNPELPRTHHASGLWAGAMQALEEQSCAIQAREQELSRTLQVFRNTIESLQDAVVILHPNNTVAWSNAAAQSLLGIDYREASGKPLSDCIRDPLLKEYLHNADYDRPLIMASPSYRPRTLKLAVSSPGRTSSQHVIIARDISQQHHLDEAQQDFITNISHELRTPLTVITGLLEQLEEYTDDSETAVRITGIMQNQVLRMRDLVTGLLDLALIESGETEIRTECVPVGALIEMILAEARTLSVDSGHVVTTNVMPGYGLCGNAVGLRNAFTNLVINAIRHTPDRAEVRIGWTVNDAGGCFSVSDSGEGIPARHIPRLTERFYRVDSSRSIDTGGIGIGLSIVRQVLEQHGATLEIESSTRHGSTFSCRFPPSRLVSLQDDGTCPG